MPRPPRRAAYRTHRGYDVVLVWQVTPPILNSRGADSRACHDLRAVGQAAGTLARFEVPAHTFTRQQNLRAKATRLIAVALRQIPPADTRGKAQIVLHFGTAPRLPPDLRPFHPDGLQSLGFPV